MKLRHLEMALQRCKGFEKPRAEWEQYQTPAPLGARLLYDAFLHGDIERKAVMDLGCGTGILAIGAALLGAKKVMAVDFDPGAIRAAQTNAALFEVDISFIVSDLSSPTATPTLEEQVGPCDTVIMNPPFGAQKQKLHADRPFIDCALVLAPVTYGIFNAGSTPFVESYIKGRGKVTGQVGGIFPIKRSFSFHTKEVHEVIIEILRITRT
ncbi:MAG: METTL5 family protein [Methanoregula sp.]|uniref:METTL5 family protein n=1 Tax=Methanoregula sp. TaxID=2052170 RepID=UPI003BAFCAE8